MIYLVLYLLLGLPMSIIGAVAMQGKLLFALFAWVTWPAWTALNIHWMITKNRAWYETRRCGYCEKVLPKDVEVIRAHVIQCDANPLVLEVHFLRFTLGRIANGYIPECGAAKFAEAVLSEDMPPDGSAWAHVERKTEGEVTK